MTRKSVWLATVVLAAASAGAGAVVPEDFAYGLELRAEPGRPVQRLELPEHVYRGVTNPDLADLRVFNAVGQVVPHSVNLPTAAQAEASWQGVPFFPLPVTVEAPASVLELTPAPEGTVLRWRDGNQDVEEQAIGAYVLDLSGIEQPVDGLRLDWRAADSSGLLAALSVEVSDDLQSWRSLRRDASVAKLSYGGHALVQDRIDLPATRGRYLRLSWPVDSAAHLVGAEMRLQPERAPVSRRWLELSPVAELKPSVWLYDTEGYFPVDRVGLEFASVNQLAEVDIHSRRSAEEIWGHRYKGLFYRLGLDEGELVRASQPVRRSSDKFWQLTGTLEAPVLRLGWTPHELLFVASGEGPFLLAYGSRDMSARALPVQQLLKVGAERGVLGQAEVVSMRELGGASRVRAPLPWLQWLLWGVLLAAVGVLAALAWRLAKGA